MGRHPGIQTDLHGKIGDERGSGCNRLRNAILTQDTALRSQEFLLQMKVVAILIPSLRSPTTTFNLRRPSSCEIFFHPLILIFANFPTGIAPIKNLPSRVLLVTSTYIPSADRAGRTPPAWPAEKPEHTGDHKKDHDHHEREGENPHPSKAAFPPHVRFHRLSFLECEHHHSFAHRATSRFYTPRGRSLIRPLPN